MRGHTVMKVVAVAALALCGAATGWSAIGRDSAGSVPVSGVRPVWSPDGKQIAFADIVGTTVNGSWGIFVVNADGSGRRQLTRGSTYAPQGISWSPDGKTIAYDGFPGQDGPTSVYTVPVAGGTAKLVTTGWSPAWASASKLVVTDETEGQFGRDVHLYSVNPDGTGRDTYVQCPEIDVNQPCGDGDAVFSADGKKIVFDQNLFGAAYAIYTMNPDGSGRLQVTPYSPPSTSPAWGPNASSIVYVKHDLSNDTTKDEIHTMNADGSNDKLLVKDGRQPSWSPDGKTILFTRSAGTTTTLYEMDSDGSNVRQLMAPSGSTPTTTVSTGPRCIVPNVVGKPLAKAKQLLTKARCKTGAVTRVRSATIAVGKVVSTKPKAGRVLAVNAKIALAVSRGKK